MVFKQEGWLPHLLETVPIEARKNQTSLYTIALEGWRRGLQLKFYNRNENNKFQIRFSLTYKDKTHHFNGSAGDLVTEEAIEICDDKAQTNYYLLNAGVPIPKGREFGPEASDEDILEYARKIEYPLVLKPTNGKAGRGVFAGIKNENQMKEALQIVREALGYKEVLVQEYVVGDEVRIYVLNNRVLAASNRRPANIVGDGKSTIKQLIRAKNEFRKYIPHLYFRPIKIDKEVMNAIESKGYTLDSIPKKDERIYLRKISNVSRGGDPVDVLDQLTKEQKDIAIRATKAIPGLAQSGVDMILNEKKGTGVILELNTRPGIGNHLFPLEGKATDVPKEIIDFYFPETKDISTTDSNVYFGFGTIINSLRGRSTIQIEVQPHPGRLTAKRVVMNGKVDLYAFHQWLQKFVYDQNLHGFVQRIGTDNLELIIAGKLQKDLDDFSETIKMSANKFKLKIASEEEWHQPIKLGFELRDGVNTLTLKELRSELRDLENEKKLIEKEKKRLKHRITLLEESRAWKMTKPIRTIMKKK